MQPQQTVQSSPKASAARWAYLVVGTLALLFLGLIYAWSVFIAPLEAEFGWNRAETSMTFTLSIIFFCLGGILGGILTQKLSARLVLVFSGAVIFLGFMLASRVSTLPGIYIAYGVCVGLGVGLAYNALISTVTRWFPDKKGLCSGILLMGFGAGGMLLGSVATGLMATIGWRTMFFVFAIVFALVLLAAALIIKPAAPGAAPAAKSGANAAPVADVGPLQMVKTKNFWMYFFWSLFLVASGLIIIGHAAAAATDLGSPQNTAAIIAGLVSVANGLGRVLFGVLFDRLALQKTMRLISLCALLSPACLLLAFFTGQTALLAVGFLLTGAFYGGVPTMSSTFTASNYGAAHFAVNFPVVNSVLLFAPLIGSYLSGSLRLASGSYLSSYLVMLAFGLAGLVFCLQVKKAD